MKIEKWFSIKKANKILQKNKILYVNYSDLKYLEKKYIDNEIIYKAIKRLKYYIFTGI